MKKLSVLFTNLRTALFPTEEDKTWKQWVDFKSREDNDLIKLLSLDGIKDGYKKRAIFLLLTPSSDLNPIYWKNEVGKFYQGTDFLKTLSQPLLNYAAELISDFCRIINPMHCEYPQEFISGGGGIMIHIQIPDKFHLPLSFYNRCVLKLLPLLSTEQGEKTFSLFRLLDISSYSNLDDASGYNPFEALLADDIDEKWKRAADKKMQKIVEAEITGKAKPREEWEDALSGYSRAVQAQLYSGPKYSADLFAEQIQFILNCQAKKQLIENYHIAKMFKVLAGDLYKSLRYKIASSVVFGQTEENKFFIYSEETAEAARQMIAEFGSDLEMLSRLTLLVKKNEENRAETEAQKLKEQQAEENIIAQMK